MTDKEYIKVKALGTITAAINTLRDLVPDNLEDVITKEEYNKVMPTLCDWQERLFEQVNMNKQEWEKIEKDFKEWDEKGKFSASQRQILDWFKKRFSGKP